MERINVRKLDNKVAIITGGGSGIGKQTAMLFAEEGAQVVITDIDKNKGEPVLEEIQNITNDVLFIEHDVSKEEDWKYVVSKTKEQFKKIDVLFNNAGIYIIKPIPEIELDTWNNLMNINVTGVFLGLKHALLEMEKNNVGSVINASSTAGLSGATGHLLYGASKGAVRIMTKDAAAEYAAKGIRVNSIHPGYISTNMANYASETINIPMEQLNEMYPLGRLGHPKEVAKTVLSLASDDSSFSTGSEFVIDGGESNIS